MCALHMRIAIPQVESWDKKLALVSETLDEWLTVQVRGVSVSVCLSVCSSFGAL